MPIFCVYLLIRHVKVIAEPTRLPKFYNLAIELIVSMGMAAFGKVRGNIPTINRGRQWAVSVFEVCLSKFYQACLTNV